MFNPRAFAEKYLLARQAAIKEKPLNGLCGMELEWNMLDQGDRRKVDVTVVGTIPDVFGLSVYGTPETVRRIVGEEGSVSSVLVTVDRDEEEALVKRLTTMRNVASINRRSEAYLNFQKQTNYMDVTMAILGRQKVSEKRSPGCVSSLV